MSGTLGVLCCGGGHIVRDTIHLTCYQTASIFNGFQLLICHALCPLQIAFTCTVTIGRNDGNGVLILLRIACERVVTRYGYVKGVYNLRLRAKRSAYLQTIYAALKPFARLQLNTERVIA